MGSGLLVDFSCLCEAHTDAALEFIFKAQSEDPGDDSLWDQHPNPLIRRIIELFTQRGLARSGSINSELNYYLSGRAFAGGSGPHAAPRPSDAMVRWSETELAVVRLYLKSLPAADFTLDDLMLLVDYTVQRYLPADDLRTDAQWLATRASIMGRVEAAMGGYPRSPEAIDKMLANMPSSPASAAARFEMSPAQRAALEYGNARCVENVVALTDGARHRLRRVVMDYSQGAATGDRATAYGALQTRLVDTFGTMNRDWRRIAITEAGENLNQGLVASMHVGTRLKRVEKYRGACAFCRSIDGRVVHVVSPDDPAKDGETMVWVGKTNIGRSASPRRRVGSTLIEREPKERWWIASGIMHPNCRGGWVQIQEPTRAVDPKFSAWMDQVLGRSANAGTG